MIWIILVPVAALVAYWYNRKFNDKWTCVFGTVFVGTIAALFLNILCGDAVTKTVKYETNQLVAMAPVSGFHGSFFLGSGSVGSNTDYKYYQMHADGGMTLESEDTQDSKVYYYNGTPHVDVFHDVSTSIFWSILPSSSNRNYKFYVPQGSITQSINLSIK